MNLPHAVLRHRIDEAMRVEAVVHARHVDVVDIEQQLAVGAARELGDEFPFAHLVAVERDIARHVLQQQAAT